MTAPLDLDAIKAGRELDALVAEKVMGLQNVGLDFMRDGSSDEFADSLRNAGRDLVPHYSTDIAAAWEVIEKMHADSFDASIDDSFGKRTVSFRRYFIYENGLRYYKTRLPLAFGESDTAPLAICLAALKAVEAP